MSRVRFRETPGGWRSLGGFTSGLSRILGVAAWIVRPR